MNKEEKEIEKIEKLFSPMGNLKHFWYINSVCMGKISEWASKEDKVKRFKRFLKRRKEKGIATDNFS